MMKLGVSFYYVGHIQKATEMYSRFLGVQPAYADDDWVKFHLEGGDLALHYHPNLQETKESTSPKYGATVSFSVPEIHQALAHATECGFNQVGTVDEQPFGKLANIQDPWGNRISLFEPSENNG